MLYSTTRGTSGDMERETWAARQEALVNMFRYLGIRIVIFHLDSHEDSY